MKAEVNKFINRVKDRNKKEGRLGGFMHEMIKGRYFALLKKKPSGPT